MALKLPKFLTGTDAKSRIVILFAGVAGFFLLIYLAVTYLSGNETTTGPSKVAAAPSGLKSVPGSELSPEYYRALTQANVQAAQQAQVTGGSSVPTLINVPTQMASSNGECTILCPSEDKVNVIDSINDLVRSGKISQELANTLTDLSKKNLSVDEYAAALDELVRQGKLTPEQARELLEKYKKQRANALLLDSAKAMDGMIKAGQLSLTAANQLLDMQKKEPKPGEFEAQAQLLVNDGKLSQAVADAIVGQYTKQYQGELAKKGAFAISQMAKSGQITGEVAKSLTDLQNKNVPLDQYATELDRLVKQGKMTPEAASKLLAMYKSLREAGGAVTCLQPLLAKGPDAAAQMQRLLNLQANNASMTQYTDELKKGVEAGLVTPEMAACALKEYQALMVIPQYGGATTPSVESNIPGAKDFAALQQRVQGAQRAPAGPGAQVSKQEEQQFLAAQAQMKAQEEQAKRDRIQNIQSAMASQAQSLLAAWQPPTMSHVGTPPEPPKPLTEGAGVGIGGGGTKTTTGTGGEEAAVKPALIKAGTIYFAVLDTAVDSDYPDTPVMATIVDGPFKGSKLLGKLSLAQGKDKVSLNFTSMDREDWAATKDVSAFAIDPDTARTVLASSVDYHYLKRYGAMMAAAFVTGYSSAITQAGTSTTGIFGTSTDHPELSPTDKIAVGIGQVGTTMGQAISSYINTPTTVKVNSGVGIGILFTSAVTE